ncbi:hypothetical protein [Streptomyces fractus]|uniref:hypothetical protein n=1 Tax=Streptomyces fractus TaxID=641806 RepID=UPI003CE97859
MGIDWAALALVFLVAVGITAILLALFTTGMVALSRARTAHGGGATATRGAAYLCFAACGGAALYALTLVS